MEERIIETETLGKFGVETLRARMEWTNFRCISGSPYTYSFYTKGGDEISLGFSDFLSPLACAAVNERMKNRKPLCSEEEALEDAGKWFEKNKKIDPFYLLTFVERVIKLRDYDKEKQDCIKEVNKDVEKIVQWAAKIIEKEWMEET